MIILSFVFPLFLGYAFHLSSKRQENKSILDILTIIYVGFGLNSLFFVCFKFLGFSSDLLVLFEFSSLLVFTYIFYRYYRKKKSKFDFKITIKDYDWFHFLAIALFFIFILLNIISIANYSFSIPHGGIDAWAIWNLKARFIYLGNTANLPNMFSSEISWSHPDYPLFLSGTIAYFWTYFGKMSVLVPMAIAIAISFFSIMLLFFEVLKKSGHWLGLIAGLILLGTPSFLIHGSSQFADNLLGFGLLIIFVELSDFWKACCDRSAWRMGLIISLVAWVKNEGFLILLIFSFVIPLAFYFKKQKRKIASYFLGIIPILLFLFAYKLIGNVSNDVVNLQSLSDVQKNANIISKIEIIFRELLLHLSEFRGVVPDDLLIIILTISLPIILISSKLRKDPLLISFFCFFLILIGYLSVYLITPLDMIDHINSSLNRLLLQLWPSFLFLFFSGYTNVRLLLSKTKKEE